LKLNEEKSKLEQRLSEQISNISEFERLVEISKQSESSISIELSKKQIELESTKSQVMILDFELESTKSQLISIQSQLEIANQNMKNNGTELNSILIETRQNLKRKEENLKRKEEEIQRKDKLIESEIKTNQELNEKMIQMKSENEFQVRKLKEEVKELENRVLELTNSIDSLNFQLSKTTKER